MQGFTHFPNRLFIKRIDEDIYNKLFDVLLNIDTQAPVRNVINVQRVKQSNVSIEKTIPIAQRLELQSLEYIFGLEFTDEPINNTIQVCVIAKIQLRDQIIGSNQIDQNEKQIWLDQLDSQSCTEQTIDNIKRSFEQHITKCTVNKQITNAIQVICGYATKHYLNGERKIGSLTLPNMEGMQEDILQFFNNQQIQDQISGSGVGKQFYNITKNPATSLAWNLVVRGIKNKKDAPVVSDQDMDGEISD